jgi:hypothetical protein
MGRGDNRKTIKMRRKTARKKLKLRIKKKIEAGSNK